MLGGMVMHSFPFLSEQWPKPIQRAIQEVAPTVMQTRVN